MDNIDCNYLCEKEKVVGDSVCTAENVDLGLVEAEEQLKNERMHRAVRSSQIGLPKYPNHGVIGSLVPSGMNAFFKLEPQATDFKKQRFDFYETYERHLDEKSITKCATPIPGLGYLQRGVKTADVYAIDPTLPLRFRNPDLLQGYGCEMEEHPLFKTTSANYGKFAPSVHDVPHEYHGLKNTFTKHLSSAGMPRNRSLNIK